jgi:large subunit ribosomal protein L28
LKCELCEKSLLWGHNVSHSKRHTNRQWIANVHPARVLVNGEYKRLNVCTRCLRTLNKAA